MLTHEQGSEDARTWADYINVGMEHGAFDMAGLAEYMRGLVDGGPTRSGHRTPTVIVEAPVNGTDEANVRFNAWQFRQILGRGVHGILLCQAETAARCARLSRAAATRTTSRGRPVAADAAGAPARRGRRAPQRCGCRRAAARHRHARPRLGSDRGADLGHLGPEYRERCDPWPLNPQGELLLGVKLESPEGVASCEEILAVPGLGFAEMGPGDLSLALGYREMPRDPYPPEMQEAREKVFAACREHGVAFLEIGTPENDRRQLDEGVRVIAGHREETARVGRAHQKRTMPV